ncbi:MAG TPA: hypothetical protein VKR52_20145 [Terracidiphilus sp.]|nr:hypothetical protein [Terracidiphilus sp.]
MLHAFVALASGFAALMTLVLGLRGIFQLLTPSLVELQAQPGFGYTLVNLGSSFLSAAVGGYVTAWIGSANPLIYVLALAIIILALAALSALQGRGKQPIWYQLAQVAVSPIGVFAGGLVRLRTLGVF